MNSLTRRNILGETEKKTENGKGGKIERKKTMLKRKRKKRERQNSRRV